MNRLSFLLARTLRREAPLAALSLSEDALLARFATERIALVGNARSLSGTSFGEEIDAADLVIRLNRAPMPSATSHGTRTDVLALATSLNAEALQELSPRLTLWMSHKRKRLPWHVATRRGFYLHPLKDHADLKQRLGAPPSTGLMMIDLLARSRAAGVTLFGFDFFASLSLTGSRSADRVPHDFGAEAAFVRDLLQRDPRFALRSAQT
ncbi:glycosyltransferase family 29 protein [Cereibacter sphaeroides]|uniref:glycosyltransferase family 29 protein n=1 Tax=Cereibacter sphaeroides TaxID=1063 RepID=UPI001F32A9DD|nr:glycosyltransferase family 29 protein [Cereibacter sphaeroides]MCE6960883.1 glycosyltransferase family 29 protein [Cereibacter sphaeroides]MCE6969819.1 glycosyltransferase family 29 protein [Cereibacter sphaeroides]MCE6975294.1 glycosyltransferase family 29 protein [Cereibacter sphaeroides]